MSVRAKLQVTSVTPNDGGGHMVRLEARYDESIPEDRRFSDATPFGHFEMLINNPAAVEELQPGKSFYIDLTPVPAGQ